MGVAFDAALRPLGITAAQASVLLHVDRYPKATMAELARLGSVTPQTMHRIVVGLERRGLVQRLPLERNRKALEVTLTESGAKTLSRAETMIRNEQDVILRHFNRAEIAQFAEFLARFEQVYASGAGAT